MSAGGDVSTAPVSSEPGAQTVAGVFAFYKEYVKPLYTEIEARNNTLPIELLFEIHASFDHLRRVFVDQEDEAREIRRALGHLKRGSLDAFKLKLKYFHEDVTKLLGKRMDFEIIDHGNFLSNLLGDKQRIIKLAREARLNESKADPEDAFADWTATSLAIDDFYTKYLHRESDFDWATQQTKRRITRNRVSDIWTGLCVGVVAGIIATWLFRYFFN